MAYYKFNRNDVYHNTLKTYPSTKFLIYNGSAFYNNAPNVAGAFAVRRRHNFTGRRICLVDDIKTTGATLNECAKVLKEAGASEVFALVLAVTGQNIN